MLRKRALQAILVSAVVSFISFGASNHNLSAANVCDVLPASGVALALEEGVALDEIYVESKSEDAPEVISFDQLVSNDKEELGQIVREDEVVDLLSNNIESDDEDAVMGRSTSDELVDEGLVASADVNIQGIIDIQQPVEENTEEAISFITSGVCMATEKAEALNTERVTTIQEEAARDPENFSNLVIADVDNYVNVRDLPTTDGEVVGKLYDNSVGEFLGEEDGWYKIKSGNVTGYVKGEYCVTGDAAIDRAKEVGVRMAMVNTTTLKVRVEPSTESAVLGLVPIEEDLSVLEELDGWVKVSIEEGEGYVSLDYVILRTDFVYAESKAEEEARLEKERKEKEAAQAAARKAQAAREAQAAANGGTGNGSSGSSYQTPVIGGNSMGSAVAQYACGFIGNPYVYGGTSLTNGTDCSGFVMGVYGAYGVSLPHSSAGDRSVGYAVEGGLANAQPGDLICYSGHVAIYIGNGRIVHASTPATGICTGSATYRDILAVRRIF